MLSLDCRLLFVIVGVFSPLFIVYFPLDVMVLEFMLVFCEFSISFIPTFSHGM